MKLATIDDGTRDGQLAVVKRDGSALAPAQGIARTLQAALDDWERAAPLLRRLAAQVESGEADTAPVRLERLLAPLPRAFEWVDGSAFLNHVRLVRKARGAEPPKTLETDPLVYQGGSSELLAPTSDIPLGEEAWGLDFEAEVCVILGDTPQGVKAEEAEKHIRLLTICNDVSLRGLIPGELAKGFGFFQSKPATAFAPFAVTPDELGDTWREGRLHLDMLVTHRGEQVGRANAGPEMHFSFHDLVAHITKTRRFTAGTILGSGTVSNEDRSRGISCLAERRMIETIEAGAPSTPFMKVGERVHIEMKNAAGESVFGAIDQKVVPA
jgi:fumarylacetoacetate (FAA) hydrolase